MKNIIILAVIFFTLQTVNAQQKVVAECTVNYTVFVDSSTVDKKVTESMKGLTKTVFIKGNDSRTDVASVSFSQSIIYDKTTGRAVILREFGNNKFLTKLEADKWIIENKKFDNLVFTPLNENKNIAGYDCKKGTIQLIDGNKYTLYYSTTIVPSVKEFEYQFRNIPGLVLEYESTDIGGNKIKYTANKVNLNPIPASKFIVPTSGYRILDAN